MIIALHGDFAKPTMLERDMGNLSPMVDLFWDANGWRRTNREIDRLEAYIRTLDQPPTPALFSVINCLRLSNQVQYGSWL